MTIIAIDGPAASGKSTIARVVAQKIGWKYINTGSIYRCLAYLIGDELNDELPVEVLQSACVRIQHSLEFKDDSIFFEHQDIKKKLMSNEISHGASLLGNRLEVRELLLPIQRQYAERYQNIILDGRDIGTVVFPEAELKIFLTASLEVRSQRRFLELSSKSGDTVSLEDIQKKIFSRDRMDTRRKIAPLQPAKDAWVLDSTFMGIEALCDMIIQEIKNRKLISFVP